MSKHFIVKLGLFENFEKKYDYEDLLLLAFVLPKSTPLTYAGIIGVYPILSKAHAYEIISLRKDLYPKIKKNLTKIG